MKHLLLRAEPLIWLLFGGGIMGGTILLTGWVMVVGIAAPLGIVPPEAMDYGRVYALASHPIGRLVIMLTAVLPLWKGAHHLRHLSIDHGGEERDTIVAPILYGIAIIGSIVGIVGAIRL
jgi:fumarate reductase subunit D